MTRNPALDLTRDHTVTLDPLVLWAGWKPPAPLITLAALPFPADFAERMNAGIRAAVETMKRDLRAAFRSLARFDQILRDAANESGRVAGLCGTYQVRAAADPAYATDCGALVRDIMRGTGHDDAPTGLLTRENRSLVAAAALRGWNHLHVETPPAPAMFEWSYGRGVTVSAREYRVPR